MYAKLALRNVKRQIGNYFIYFITVVLTVALLFAAGNIIFSDNLARFTIKRDELQSALCGVVIFISLIVAFILSYATSFMLKLRKREFGTYLTLGMSRKNILIIFISETMLICIGALGLGLALGLFLYQSMMAVFMRLLEMEFTLAAYSPKGLLLTIILTIGIFLLASLTSAVYLKRVSIYDLIHGSKKLEKPVKHPVFWFIAALFSFAVLAGSILFFNQEVRQVLLHGATAGRMIYSLFALAVSIILFHIALARSLIYALLHRKRLCSKGTNTFVLRQLSGTLSSNSIMLGFLAFLLCFAVIGSNVSFMQKSAADASLNTTHPYDIRYTKNLDSELSGINNSPGEGIPVSEGEAIINKYVKIKSKSDYGIYTTGRNDFYSRTRWSGEGYEGLTDSFMKLSDFNALITPLGYDAVTLKNEYMIIGCVPEISSIDWNSFVFKQGGTQYTFHSAHLEYPIFSFQYFYVVLPDNAITGMEQAIQYTVYDTENKKYDAQALKAELSYTDAWNGHEETRTVCDYSLREYSRQSNNGQTAILTISALFVAAIFLFMAMAILALKTLSALSADKQRYEILNRLGTGNALLKRTLFRQIFSFFMVPFVIPLLISIPTACICHNIFILNSTPALVAQVPVIAGTIAAVMLLIYLLYYTATYFIAKRTVIRPEAR